MWAVVLISLLVLATSQSCRPGTYPNAATPPGFCAYQWANGLSRPRGLWVASNGDLLVLESGTNQILALWDSNLDGKSDATERAVLGRIAGLNHGITVHGDFLYASTPSTLWRFLYSPTERKLSNPTVVVSGIPSDGHQTRTPRFDSNGMLYLSLGSASNIDSNSNHAQVRQFDLSQQIPVPWQAGRVWSDGLRNEVGLTFDRQGRLWGVMNGMDDLYRADLGGDIHNLNPAEEINLLDREGRFYGYPYCWAEFDLGRFSKGRGTMWAHANFMHDGVHTDAWCGNHSNVQPPAHCLPPHTAPLDIVFWYSDAFGPEYNGDAFVSLHGSWNRQPPAGYRVNRVRYLNGTPREDSPFLWHAGSAERWPNNFRPVGLAWSEKNCQFGECLFVSSDGSSDIVYIAKEF